MPARLPHPGEGVRCTRSVSALLRLVLVLLLGLATVLLPGIPSARADDEAQPVAIAFEGMDPALPDRNATITLRGTVTNNSGEPLSGVQAIFWRDQSPITDSSAFASALASAPTQPFGSRVFDKVGAYQDLTSQQRLTIAPGETVPFQVQARVADLELPRTAGAYLIGIHVLGRIGRKANATIGRSRLLVPLPREGSMVQLPPIPTVTAVVLSSRPSMIDAGLFADDHLSDELSAGGRLTLLLRAARREKVSFLIDPSLLDEVSTMAAEDGYQVRQPDGRTAPGVGSQVARRWLEEFGRLNMLDGFRLPFGTPDLSALAHQRSEAVLRRTIAAADRPSRVRDLPLIAWSADGSVAPDTVATWEQTGAAAILTSNAQTSQALVKGPGPIPLISYNPNLFDGGPGPDPRMTTVHLRQRLLAESYLDSMNRRSTPHVRVISTAAQASADLASDAPWVQRQSLGELMDSRPAEWSGELVYSPAAQAAELSPAQGATLTELHNSYAAYADLVVDPEATNERADAALSRAASGWWRGDQPGFEAFTRPQLAVARGLLTGSTITLNVQKSVIMSGQSGSFPITVVNGLNESVRVNVSFDSDQPQRLSIPSQRDIIIEPNRSTTVNIQPRAAGNGPVRVSAQLSTANGTPLGRRTAFSVEATNFGFVGWIIVVASGIVLLGATALRIRQVRRERHAAHVLTPTGVDQAGGDEHQTPKVITIDPLPKETPDE